jgi:hypothetical protein
MLRWWRVFGLMTALLLSLNGCKAPQQQIKPRRPPEEYVDPPEGDKRYDQPVEYPKGTLNQDKQIYGKDFVPPNAPGANGAPKTPGVSPGVGTTGPH